jgi:hypothetical protein
MKRKGLFELILLEVSVHNQLALLHNGDAKEKGDQDPIIHFKGMPSMT